MLSQEKAPGGFQDKKKKAKYNQERMSTETNLELCGPTKQTNKIKTTAVALFNDILVFIFIFLVYVYGVTKSPMYRTHGPCLVERSFAECQMTSN